MKAYFWIVPFFIGAELGKYLFYPPYLNCSLGRLSGFALLVLILMGFFLTKHKFKNSYAGFFLFVAIGGGLSNLLEGVSGGCINDYFNFFNLFHFNLADIFVSTGLFALGILIIHDKL